MRHPINFSPLRHRLLAGAVLAGFVGLFARVAVLQLIDHDFLQHQGDARHLRTVALPAHRGMVTDRAGEPLAVSTPVESVWANPGELLPAHQDIVRVARVLHLDPERLTSMLTRRQKREFVYLRRHVPPALAEQVMALEAPGVALQREYRRYYPTGEVTAHLIGFTNIDDKGQEGLELAYGEWLRGEPGAKRVIKDGRNRIIENVESIRAPRPGHDLKLSIDRRIQYLAYRELKAAVKLHQAKSGSAVVLDNRTGEILALVNQPSYNPNNRERLKPGLSRNRAVTDVVEPGSTLKPFIIAAALQSGRYHADTPINTAPGYLQVGVNTVHDVHNYGMLDVAGVIRKSSNVGAAKIALDLTPDAIRNVLQRAGFGTTTGSAFPGESDGYLPDHRHWRDIERATLAFGYGLSVTTLQLADAYSIFANDGFRMPVSLVYEEQRRVEPQQVVPAWIARQVRTMMEAVTHPGGTAPDARVNGYRVAGKTGTVHKSIAGGYAEDRYIALFAGLAPASRPRLVCVVIINEPGGKDYYGGKVAGPVFSKIMAGALRLLNVAPDDVSLLETRLGGEGPA
jgi:cell division protein FtsI (penicillin-binding protein 3)